MISIPNSFRAELNKQIRRPGHCQITFQYGSGGSYNVPEAYIKSVEFHNIGDPMSRRLPTEECTLAVLDYERLFDPSTIGSYANNLDAGMTMLVRIGIETYDGQTAWSDYVDYRMNGKHEWDNFTAKFKFTRRIGALTVPFHGIAQSVTDLSELCDDALLCANYSLLDLNYTKKSPKLANCPIINNTDIKNKTVADTLLTIAFATGTSLRSYFSGIEVLDHYHVTEQGTALNPAVIPNIDILDVPKFDRLPPIKEVVSTYLVDPDTPKDRETLFTITGGTEIPTASTPLSIYFDTSITGGSFQFDRQENISSINYVVYRDHIVITDIVLAQSGVPYNLQGSGRPIYAETKKNTLTSPDGTENEEIENELLNKSNCVLEYNQYFGPPISVIRAEYYRKTRELYEFSYRGDPSIEHLDIITVDLPGYGFSQCIVVESTFRFENGFSGKLKVRRIDDPDPWQISHCAISDLAISDYAISDSLS